MLRALRSRVGVIWPVVGLVGSVTAAIAATGLLSHRPTRWWWEVDLGTHGVQWHVFWAGVILLCVAWAGLGVRLHRRPGATVRELVWVGALWSLPLMLGPALFSLDMYSYLAQGAVLAHGLNPYHTAPQALHDPRLLAGVSGTWTHTTTPYGPVFIGLAAVVQRLAGPHITLGIVLLRVPELLGLGLLAWAVPRLARNLGADPARATWLAVISPLSLLYLVAGGHNDALMAGLMAAGVAMAVERRPLLGIVLCSLAATVKLPAAAAVVMIAICWWRAEPARWRAILATGGAGAATVVLAAGALTGVGLSWISGSLFSTPAAARMALTPSTAISVSLWEITHRFGAGVEQAAASWENAATVIAFVLVGLVALGLCRRVSYRTLPRYLGLALIAAALGGPAAWPWYLSWGVVLLAADRRAQRAVWLPAVLVLCAFPVMASGQVAVPLPDSLIMVGVYGLAILAWVLGPRMQRRLALPPLRRLRVSVSPIGHASGESSSIAAPEATG
jgi:alpha-1,6-mannosyltransferase